MQSALIVESEVTRPGLFRLLDRLVGVKIHHFIFDSLPQSFDEHVIASVAATIHAGADVMALKKIDECIACELTALVSKVFVKGLPKPTAAAIKETKKVA